MDIEPVADGFQGDRATLSFKMNRVVKRWFLWLGDMWFDCYGSYNSDHVVFSGSPKVGPLTIERNARGILQIDQLVVNSGFPFGFFHLHWGLQQTWKTYIFPQPIFFDGALISQVIPGSNSIQIDEFNLLENYREGDDVRRIHWKKSTLSEWPVVRKNRGDLKWEQSNLFIPDPCPDFELALRVFVGIVLERPWGDWSILTESGDVVTYSSQLDFLKALAVISPISFSPDPGIRDLPIFASQLYQLYLENPSDQSRA